MSESKPSKEKVSKDKNPKAKMLWEILRQETKFQIYGNLCVSRELSLSDLAKIINKSKSTIHEHLQNLIDWGYVEISREEQVRSNIFKKYYRWNKKADFATCIWDKNEKMNEKTAREKIETWRSFAAYNQNIMNNYLKFLDKLDKLLDTNDEEEKNKVFKILEEIKSNDTKPKPFHSVAFYTPENALKFYNKLHEIYKEIPDEERSEAEESPYYGGFWILPIKLIMDKLISEDLGM